MKLIYPIIFLLIIISITGCTETTYIQTPHITSTSLKSVTTMTTTLPPTTTTTQTPTITQGSNAQTFMVSKVVDGDTIEIETGEKVRYLGIDTPEMSGDCFSQQATIRNRELVGGKLVSLESDETQGDKDRYGRLLRYIYVDGQDVNAILVQEGLAKAYIEYPVKKINQYIQLEQEAKDYKRGMWADDACPISLPATTTPSDTLSSEGFSCSIKKTCGEMSSCAEARYHFTTCSNARLDGDKDGVPCETLCPGG